MAISLLHSYLGLQVGAYDLLGVNYASCINGAGPLLKSALPQTYPRSGLRRDSWWLSHQESVWIFVGTTLCPYGLPTVGWMIRWWVFHKIFFESAVCCDHAVSNKLFAPSLRSTWGVA